MCGAELSVREEREEREERGEGAGPTGLNGPSELLGRREESWAMRKKSEREKGLGPKKSLGLNFYDF
jgi:hypothetical protein